MIKHEKQGALIVIKKRDSLDEHINNGVELNAKISKEVLLSIFSEKSPLHDGAVIITGNIITRAGAMLPIDSEVEDYQLGARHKAAVGISKVTDAIAIIVSQERNIISLAIEGKIESDLESEELKFHLLNQLTKKIDIKEKVGNLFPNAKSNQQKPQKFQRSQSQNKRHNNRFQRFSGKK